MKEVCARSSKWAKTKSVEGLGHLGEDAWQIGSSKRFDQKSLLKDGSKVTLHEYSAILEAVKHIQYSYLKSDHSLKIVGDVEGTELDTMETNLIKLSDLEDRVINCLKQMRVTGQEPGGLLQTIADLKKLETLTNVGHLHQYSKAIETGKASKAISVCLYEYLGSCLYR